MVLQFINLYPMSMYAILRFYSQDLPEVGLYNLLDLNNPP